MREIDDPHHPEDDRQSGRRKHEEREGITELIEKREDLLQHAASFPDPDDRLAKGEGNRRNSRSPSHRHAAAQFCAGGLLGVY